MKTVGIVFQRDKGLQDIKAQEVLRGPSTDQLAHKLNFSKLQHRDDSLKTTSVIQGETKLANFRSRTGRVGVGTATSGDRSTGRYYYSFVELPHWRRKTSNLSSPFIPLK